MDHEHLFLLAKVADDVEDLAARVGQQLRDRAYTKVQPVVLAWGNRDELLQSLDAAKNSVDSPQPGVVRHGRVVRVAGEAHAALLRDWHDPLEEVGYDLPHLLSGHRPGLGQRVVGPLANVEVA